jgi:hypothetical protein
MARATQPKPAPIVRGNPGRAMPALGSRTLELEASAKTPFLSF